MYDSTGIILELPGYEKAIFSFNNMLRLDSYADDRVGFYNNLYTCIERYLNHEYDYFENVPSGKDTIDEANVSDETLNENDDMLNETGEITDEAIKQWASYDFEVAYDSPDGREYAFIPIDRALGSSFYVLMVFNEKGSPDSDHHSEKLGGARTVGIYASKDKGKTFEFVREEAE